MLYHTHSQYNWDRCYSRTRIGSRVDVWFFGPDARVWWGRHQGESNEIVHCRFRIPISFGGTGGVKLQLTGPSAPTLVRIDAFSEALVGAGQDSVTNNESDTIAYRRLGTATAFSSSFVALNSPAATVNSTVNAVLGIPQAGTTIVVEVEIVNGATAGTVVLQGAQNSANSTTTFAVGSSMAVEKKAGLAI